MKIISILQSHYIFNCIWFVYSFLHLRIDHVILPHLKFKHELPLLSCWMSISSEIARLAFQVRRPRDSFQFLAWPRFRFRTILFHQPLFLFNSVLTTGHSHAMPITTMTMTMTMIATTMTTVTMPTIMTMKMTMTMTATIPILAGLRCQVWRWRYR